jgi:hypothetical protein
MTKSNICENMKQILTDAYSKPTRKICFYSADSEKTGSDLLDNLPAWDWTPQKSHQVIGNSTCIFPLALGCKRIFSSENTEWAEAMFSEHDMLNTSQLTLGPLDVWSGRTGEMLNNIQKMVETLPLTDKIRSIDIQSPFGIAEVMCGTALYMALLSNSEPVHALLQTITDFIIKFLEEQKCVAGTRLNAATFPYIWYGCDGAYCSDDSLTLMSPKMHAEFSLPYVNQIAEQCGPLFYHSCSWSQKYFDNIKQLKNITAFNWNPANSIDPAIIIREFSGKAVLAPHMGNDVHKGKDVEKWGIFSDEVEFLRYILDSMQDNTTLYLWFYNMCQKPKVLEKMYQILDDYGYSPRAQGLF